MPPREKGINGRYDYNKPTGLPNFINQPMYENIEFRESISCDSPNLSHNILAFFIFLLACFFMIIGFGLNDFQKAPYPILGLIFILIAIWLVYLSLHLAFGI
ncbi:MAG: hypothetical protein ABSC54_04635 [Smithellaceae bacterium]